MNTGKKARALMQQQGLTQVQMASLLRITQQRISAALSQKRWKDDTVAKWAKVLRCDEKDIQA